MPVTVMHTTQDARINALRSKHEALSQKVKDAQNHPSMTGYYVSQLKKQKLVLKEKIEGIRQSG